MREILFRAKRADNGAWETGGLVVVRGGCSDEQVYISEKMTGYHTPVLPETVGQYIGQIDKNKRKIFEGDIVKFKGELYTIRYIEKYNRFAAVKPNTVFSVFSFSQAEIVGNIYDNPELLENKNLEEHENG